MKTKMRRIDKFELANTVDIKMADIAASAT
jgi:hypothetical protein